MKSNSKNIFLNLLIPVFWVFTPIFSQTNIISHNSPPSNLLQEGWEFHWKTQLVRKSPYEKLEVGCVLTLSDINTGSTSSPTPTDPLRQKALSPLPCRNTEFTPEGKALLSSTKLATDEDSLNPLVSPKFYNWSPQVRDPKSSDPLSFKGYAVYRKELDIPAGDYAVFSPSSYLADSSARIWQWEGGKLILLQEIGSPGASEEEYRMDYRLADFRFRTRGAPILYIEVANWSSSQGKLDFPSMKLGNEASIRSIRNNFLIWEVIVASLLLLSGAYHIMLYFLRKKLLSALWFGILSMFTGIRTLLMARVPQEWGVEGMSGEALLRLEYITMEAVVLFLVYLHYLFKKDTRVYPFYIVVGSGILGSIAILFLDAYTFTSNLFLFQIPVLLAAIISIYELIRKWNHEDSIIKENARILLGLVVLGFSSAIHDILMYQGLFKSINIAPYGFLLTVLGQAIIIARMNSREWANSEALTEELRITVDERTRELQSAQARAEETARELDASQQNLNRVEREAATGQLAANLAHNINNPLNYIMAGFPILEKSIRNLEEIIFEATEGVEEAEEFHNQSRNNLDRARKLLEIKKRGSRYIKNLVQEIRAISGVDGYSVEKFSVYQVLEEEHRFIASLMGKKLRLRLASRSDIKSPILWNRMVFRQVVREILFHVFSEKEDVLISVNRHNGNRDEVEYSIRYKGEVPDSTKNGNLAISLVVFEKLGGQFRSRDDKGEIELIIIIKK